MQLSATHCNSLQESHVSSTAIPQYHHDFLKIFKFYQIRFEPKPSPTAVPVPTTQPRLSTSQVPLSKVAKHTTYRLPRQRQQATNSNIHAHRPACTLNNSKIHARRPTCTFEKRRTPPKYMKICENTRKYETQRCVRPCPAIYIHINENTRQLSQSTRGVMGGPLVRFNAIRSLKMS